MDIKDAMALIKEASDEYNKAYYFKQRLKPRKSSKEYDSTMNEITIRVQNIFQSCPDLWNYVEQSDDFFSISWLQQNLEEMIKKYEKTE